MIRENDSQNLFFALGDASGKGVAASMLMSHLHAIFRTLLATGLPIHELVARASRVFCESTMSTSFATLVCGRAGPSGDVELCNAGHSPALLVQQGEVKSLAASGVPLGMFSDGEYSTQKIQLAMEDTLFLYTDGLSEARSAAEEEYGDARLIEVLKKCSSAPLRNLIENCLNDVASFRSGAPWMDDVTILAIRRAS